MIPYKDLEITDSYIIREFSENIDPIELLWHRDDESRIVEIIGNTDWQIQLDNQLPSSLNDRIFMPKHEWHRVIKGTGTLSSGNTITGATSGATASVTYVENLDSTYGGSGAGRVTVSGITGTFSDGETISNGSGWSATIRLAGGSFEGLDYNSGRMGETYLVGLSLSADRSVEMTGSDGNSVNNYLLLNEQLADDTTFTQALGVSTALDLYELENITQDVSIISAISINSRIKKAGDVNYAIPTIDIAGQKAYSTPIDITTALSYRKQHSVIDVNGLSNEPLSKQNVNDLAVGLRFK